MNMKMLNILLFLWNSIAFIGNVQAASSCLGYCDGPSSGCYCDSACTSYGDCCYDYQQQCVASPAPAPSTGVVNSSITIPSGFKSIITDKTGVTVYKKERIYTNNSGKKYDYVQVIDLSQGGCIELRYGTPSGNILLNTEKFGKESLKDAWDSFSDSNSNAVCITNGQFFDRSIDPTPLSFPLKVNGEFLTDNWADTGQTRMLQIHGSTASVQPFNDVNDIYQPSLLLSLNIIVGLTPWYKLPDQFKNGVYVGGGYKGRTFVGVSNDGTKILIFSSSSSCQNQDFCKNDPSGNAQTVLNNFGISNDNIIMFDGGGSSQLICEGTTHVYSSDNRAVPQTIGTLQAGSNSSVGSVAPGSSCGAGKVYDCVMTCVNASTAAKWIGDNACDVGGWGLNLLCPAFNNDGGDCN